MVTRLHARPILFGVLSSLTLALNLGTIAPPSPTYANDERRPTGQLPERTCPGCTYPKMTVRVVASVIEHDGEFLVCKRPAHKRHGGLWEFPGGKVENGESDFEAVKRELSEELGVNVIAVGAVQFSIADPGSEFMIEFLSVRIVGKPQCLEHASLAWVREHELLQLPLAPSDRRYVLCRLQGSRTSNL